MTHRSPLLTLAAVAIFFAALLTADFVVHPSGETATAGAPTTTVPPAVPATSATGPTTPAAATPTPVTRPAESALTPPAKSDTRDDDDQLPHKAVYAGRSEDGHLAIAVAVLGNRAAAYICDGRSREAWLRGTVDGNEVRLTSGQGYRLTAELDDNGRLEGEVRGDGKRWKFEIRRAEQPAGLYRAKGSRSTIGWIRLPDGSVVGVATDSDGTSGPAPALGADQHAEVDGQTVQAAPVDGDDEI